MYFSPHLCHVFRYKALRMSDKEFYSLVVVDDHTENNLDLVISILKTAEEMVLAQVILKLFTSDKMN